MDAETRETINSLNQSGWENAEKTMKQSFVSISDSRLSGEYRRR